MLDTNISSEIYNRIKDDNEDRIFKHWHASSLAECPLSQYMKRLQVPVLREPGAGMMLRWKAGHVLEEVIRPYLGRVESNVRMTSKKHDLTGEYDNYSPERKALVEIKSVHPAAFRDQTTMGIKETALKEWVGKLPDGRNKWGNKQEPYLHHLMQQHAYILLMAEQGVEVEEIVFVYIALDGRVVTYSEKPDQVHTDEVLRRLDVLNTAWETKTPPECICTELEHPLFKPVMQYCDYKGKDECCSLNLVNNQLIKEEE